MILRLQRIRVGAEGQPRVDPLGSRNLEAQLSEECHLAQRAKCSRTQCVGLLLKAGLQLTRIRAAPASSRFVLGQRRKPKLIHL